MRIRSLMLAAAAGFAGLSLATAPTVVTPAVAAQPEKVSVVTTAHRGAMAYAPENTLAAFEIGIKQKATWIESDVQLSKDGVPVLIHDTTLTRTTNAEEVFPDRAPWNVGDFTLDEIKQLDAGSWFSEEFAGQRVPTLSEMVSQVRKSRSGIIMELKSPELYPGVEQEVAEVFDSFPGYVNSALASKRLAVQSFNWDSMATYSKLQPDVPLGLLGTVPVDKLDDYSQWADQVNPNYKTVTPEYVDAVHEAGMVINPYTVNEVADMARLLDYDVDGIITNRPDVLENLLAQRNIDKH
jgi:glycerophosphoryl diester phosphodiesterase